MSEGTIEPGLPRVLALIWHDLCVPKADRATSGGETRPHMVGEAQRRVSDAQYRRSTTGYAGDRRAMPDGMTPYESTLTRWSQIFGTHSLPRLAGRPFIVDVRSAVALRGLQGW